MTSNPRISVIVTNYNYAQYLDQCLASIRNQTYTNFELIVVDDASTDNSLAIISKYSPDKLLALPSNIGAINTNIEGAKQAIGEYLCFIDSDDYIDPTYLEKCISVIESDSNCAIAYTDCEIIKGNQSSFLIFSDYSFVQLKKSNFILCAALVKKSVYDEVGGFDNTLPGMEDYDLWLNICKRGYIAKGIHEYLHKYRHHENSRTTKSNVNYSFETIWKKHNINQNYHVLAEVCTKDRYYTTLPLTIVAICQQTRKPDELVIFDDGEQRDTRSEPLYQYLFKLLEEKGIPWKVEFTKRIGQVWAHQRAQELAKDLIWRVDDDLIPDPNVLETLLSDFSSDVGAVGGCIFVPPVVERTPFASNKIEDYKFAPGKQHFKSPTMDIEEVDHLHCSFLFRAGVAKYDTEHLSIVGHTEETLFTYSIKRNHFRVLFDPRVVSWHFRNPQGGIRTQNDPSLWKRDEEFFDKQMLEWGVIFNTVGFFYLDNGLGDHFCFKNLIPDIKKKYSRVIISCCYPEVFKDDNVELISIAEAKAAVGDGNKYNIYKWMWDNNWKTSMLDAYRKMYEL